MIKIDASGIIPKRLGTYLLGLVPGLVFELTAAFGNPLVAHEMIERARRVYPFNAYAVLLLFVASCLVIGQTFFLLAWFSDWLIDGLYCAPRLLLFRLTLGSDWLYRAVARLQGIPAQAKRPLSLASRHVGTGGEVSIQDSSRAQVPTNGCDGASKAQVWRHSEQRPVGVGR